jgi:hypothetical protein
LVVLLTGEKDYTKKKDIICLINFLVYYGRPRHAGEKDYAKKKDIICLINFLVSYGRPRHAVSIRLREQGSDDDEKGTL